MLPLTEKPIGSKDIEQRFNEIPEFELVLFRDFIEDLKSFFEFPLHKVNSTFSKEFEFIQKLQISVNELGS